MLDYFQIDVEQGLQKASESNYNWIIIDHDSQEELSKMTKKYHLPEDVFVTSESAGEVSRIEYLKDTKLENPISLVLFDITNKDGTVEERISPLSIILSDEIFILYVGKNQSIVEKIMDTELNYYSFEQIIMNMLLTIYRHFIAELNDIKKEIDTLDNSARKNTDSEELFRLADVDREVIFINHTITDQNQTLDTLWEDEEFLKKVNHSGLIFDVKLHQKQALKLITVYHALIDTLGSLFASMIDNNLNHLMKFLESAALVLTIPTVIAGIWGMNTGGLPWEKSTSGFIIVMVLSVILTIFTWSYLKKKKYFN